jgi:type IV secretion system protein VirD4
MVMEMLRAGEVSEEDGNFRSPLDELFNYLENADPNHIAVKYYKLYRKGSGKTLKSIQITLASKLEKFNLEEMEKLTATDELDIMKMGEEKTALFIVIPDSDTSFNFLVSILYTQLFQTLFYQADHIHHGALPQHVHFVMDEFANVCLPDDFEKDLSTMRSRGVSVSIILQNLAQLKALFEKQWESIVGNCDEFLYLGGNEQSTHKYVSELLGKETLDHNTFGKSTGRNANYSTNYQISGRELLTADEVRMLDNRYAILFIRGERPVIDDKFDIMRHPNVEATADGSGGIFNHSKDNRSVASVELIGHRYMSDDEKVEEPDSEMESKYALYSETDIEDFYDEKEKQNHEETYNQVYPIKRKPKPTDEQQAIYPERRFTKTR